MKLASFSRITALLLFGLTTISPTAKATTIDWGTYIGSTSYLFDSDGANLDDSFFFELGSFGGFTPTEANMTDWAANWKPFDRAEAPTTWISASGIVASSAVLETDFTTSNTNLSQLNTFAAGEQAYIWVYKDFAGNPSPSPSYSSNLQWALVTNDATDGNAADDWLFPVPSGHIVASLDWRIEDATVSPFGGLNNVEGPGTYSSTPPEFILQTHTTSVPEPSSLFLIGTVGSLFAMRRRRYRRYA